MNKAHGTTGHSIGMSIIGKDQSPTTMAATATGGNDPVDFQNIHVEPCENGCTVEHAPKSPKGKGDESTPYQEPKRHAFASMEDAHAHIGRLMGVGGPGGKKSSGSLG